MTGKIFLKLIGFLFAIFVLALVAVDQMASSVTEDSYLESLRKDLSQKGRMLVASEQIAKLGNDPVLLKNLAQAAQARLTVIAADGLVMGDTEADPKRMENHHNRPEMADALAGRESFKTHLSVTTGLDTLYFALPFGSGALRLGVPLQNIHTSVNTVRRQLWGSTAVAFLPALFLAIFFARSVSARLGGIIEYAAQLAKGNFEAKLTQGGGDELALLRDKLLETGGKLKGMVVELEREHAELEKLERVRKDFVINVSHELRTPLASIQGYAETLLDGAMDDPEHNTRFLVIIRQNAQRLATLTADLLTLSRIELGQRKLHLAPASVKRMMEDAVDSMRPMAEKKHITLTLLAGPDDMEAFCDSDAVIQVLTNLLDNALKYTPEDGSILVGVRDQGQMVQLYIKDSGIGIPKEELPRLFERFYRVDKARSRELGGTGLGLAIVKHLVKAQGGDVTVSSEAGQGSEFAITLPVEEVLVT